MSYRPRMRRSGRSARRAAGGGQSASMSKDLLPATGCDTSRHVTARRVTRVSLYGAVFFQSQRWPYNTRIAASSLIFAIPAIFPS